MFADGVLWRTKTKHRVFSWKRLKEREREAQVKKELIEKLLEVSRQAAREVESAVTAVKDPHLRGVIAGVIMQRILDEVDINEKVASGTVSSAVHIRETRSGKAAPKRESWICDPIIFFASRAVWKRS